MWWVYSLIQSAFCRVPLQFSVRCWMCEPGKRLIHLSEKMTEAVEEFGRVGLTSARARSDDKSTGGQNETSRSRRPLVASVVTVFRLAQLRYEAGADVFAEMVHHGILEFQRFSSLGGGCDLEHELLAGIRYDVKILIALAGQFIGLPRETVELER